MATPLKFGVLADSLRFITGYQLFLMLLKNQFLRTLTFSLLSKLIQKISLSNFLISIFAVVKKSFELYVLCSSYIALNRLCKEHILLLSEETFPSEIFWELDKKIRYDKKSAGVRIELNRSNLIFNIMSLLNDDVISLEDLDEFSDELKDTINFFLNENA